MCITICALLLLHSVSCHDYMGFHGELLGFYVFFLFPLCVSFCNKDGLSTDSIRNNPEGTEGKLFFNYYFNKAFSLKNTWDIILICI